MEKIKIITDSTCDLSKSDIEMLDIEVVPLSVNIGAKSYKDGVDIDFCELNKIILRSEDFPTTSQVNPDVLKNVYEKYLNKGYKIISIHISAKISETCKSALIAKDILDTQDIIIYDSLNVSGGLAILVTEAAKMVKQGYSLDEICRHLDKGINDVKCRVMLNDLSNLIIAGRVNKTIGRFGNLIRLKPIVSMIDGELVLVDSVRGNKRGLNYLINFLDESNLDNNSKIYIMCAYEGPIVEALKTYIDNKGYKYYIIYVGCVVGSYSGAKCVGLFVKNS